jgi:uncharacterized membrane protein YphA (DoxX/SURF4 family)
MTDVATEAESRTTGRPASIGLWVLQVVLALFMGMAGAGKLAGTEMMVQTFDDVGVGQWLRYVTGALEVAGAVGLLIPLLAGLAALGLTGVLLGAVVVDAFVIDGNPFLPLILAVLTLVVVWGRRSRISELVNRLRSPA